MCESLNAGQACSERMRAQQRAAAEIIGIDEAYLSRMIHFFVARVRADKRLGRFYAVDDEEHRARQVARMATFWQSVGLETDDYAGDLVDIHRNLPDIRPEDFDRWLELFRATLDETAPTAEAARYLTIRAERVVQYLKTEIFEGRADATPELPRHRRAAGRS